MNETDDDQLLAEMAAGSNDAFSALYERYQTQLVVDIQRRFGASMRIDAEDIALETWMRILEGYRKGRFEPSKWNFRSYLFRVAKNLTVDRYRREAARRASNSDVAEAYARSEAESPLELEELQAKLESIIENLPSRQRDLVRLRLSGVSYEEISEQLNIPRNVAQGLWSKITRTLREKLELKERPPTPPIDTRRIEVFVDPGDAPATLVAELYSALDALYQACKGSGLKIAKDERRVFAGEVV
jgi:RNA polymerase sigma-70 factor (ECF subfamily)